jgi:hypothetical protein
MTAWFDEGYPYLKGGQLVIKGFKIALKGKLACAVRGSEGKSDHSKDGRYGDHLTLRRPQGG